MPYVQSDEWWNDSVGKELVDSDGLVFGLIEVPEMSVIEKVLQVYLVFLTMMNHEQMH